MDILGWTMGWCVPQWWRWNQGLLLASAVGPVRRHSVLLWVGVTRFLPGCHTCSLEMDMSQSDRSRSKIRLWIKSLDVFIACVLMSKFKMLTFHHRQNSMFLSLFIVPFCIYVPICIYVLCSYYALCSNLCLCFYGAFYVFIVFFLYLPMFYSVSKFSLCLWFLSVSLFLYVSASLCVCVQSVTMATVCAMVSICASILICDYCSCLCQLVFSGSTFLFISGSPVCVYIPVCMDRDRGMKRNTDTGRNRRHRWEDPERNRGYGREHRHRKEP